MGIAIPRPTHGAARTAAARGAGAMVVEAATAGVGARAVTGTAGGPPARTHSSAPTSVTAATGRPWCHLRWSHRPAARTRPRVLGGSRRVTRHRVAGP